MVPEFIILESSAYTPADETASNSIFPVFFKLEPLLPKIPTAFLFCIVIVPLFSPLAADV